ncbi:hypothetical protein BSLG_000191 [Batrachochytrium salamandrivorans]|nr:hypothetical protein BSLG_000191 [Batrachochytrium salamandrivorans]
MDSKPTQVGSAPLSRPDFQPSVHDETSDEIQANPLKRKEGPTVVAITEESDILKITPLGAGNEVGRSCILLEYKGKTIMASEPLASHAFMCIPEPFVASLISQCYMLLLLDCGLHPAHSGLAALPFFDNIDPETVDLVLITHFHVDHAAGLPYFMEKTTFKGRVFMTHPTRAIYKWLVSDYIKISSLSPDDQLYADKDLANSYERIEVVDYHQEVDLGGIKFTPYYAGHVLGAAMFLIEIAGVRLLYTGDYSREEDRHLMAAERPPTSIIPEVLICESTFGVQTLEPRLDREQRFTRMVHTIVKRGGRCLLPVFALGRAQELLLILDEYWHAHADLHSVPIYYASAIAKKCMTVYQTYTNMMNGRIRELAKVSNPFQFKHISNLRSIAQFDDVGPCVMMASPGMLQSGLSRELLELWCVDKRNGVIIPGYVVEGTLGKQILSQPNEIPAMNGSKLPLRLTVEYISFSAHVDYRENSEFIEMVGSQNLVLVHGDSNEMGRLRSALQSRYAEREVPLYIHTPRNCETIEFVFRGEKMAKIVGSLAQAALLGGSSKDAEVVKEEHSISQVDIKLESTSKVPSLEDKAATEIKDGTTLSGILVSKDFTFQIVAPEDLDTFTSLHTVSLTQRQTIVTQATFGLVRWHLEQMYGEVKEISKRSLMVFEAVTVHMGKENQNESDGFSMNVELEWDSNPVNDMVADSVVAVLLQADCSPASVKATKSSHSHSHDTPSSPQDQDDPSAEADIKTHIEIKSEFTTDEMAKPKDTIVTKSAATYVDFSKMDKTPALDVLLTRYLERHFGIDRVVPPPKISDATAEELDSLPAWMWIINVDDQIAAVSVSRDGSAFVSAY